MRTDSTVFRFTDHDVPLERDGQTWAPAGGLDSSATRHTQSGEPSNVELTGVLSSSTITHDDLRAGLYEDADLFSYIVDWRYPWAGVFKTEVFKIGSVEYTDQGWTADVLGRGILLLATKGAIITGTCTAALGDDRCKVDMTLLTAVDRVVSTIVGDFNRTRFRAGNVSANFNENLLVDENGTRVNNGWYNDGDIVWTVGTNTGTTQIIRKYVENNGVIWLWTSTAADIQPNDRFTIRPGCNKLAGKKNGHCILKFKEPGGTPNNIINFQGSPFTPGPGQLQKTPAINR